MNILQNIHDLFYSTTGLMDRMYQKTLTVWTTWHFPPLLLSIILMLVVATIVALFLAVNALFIIWLDRKVAAKMQARIGPNRVGPFGLFQTVADTVKLLLKEDIVPTHADKAVFNLAPILVFTATFAVFLVIPFGQGMIAADIDIGLLYILAITGLSVIGVLAAGWSSNNKYSLIGGLRSAAQIVSYEVPIVLALLPVIMFAGSLRMGDIVAAQSKTLFIALQPLGFILFLIATTAETNRSPFDLPEGESELVSGFITEYSGMKFAIFFLSEYTNLFLSGAIAATLFLGGWSGPFLPPVVWFFIKTYLVVLVLMWVRWTFPRIRIDHVMSFCWKVLVPIALLNLVVSAILVKLV